MRPDLSDVKCLHAQLADQLIRSGGNPIAEQVLKDLEGMGIRVDGTDECCDHCNLNVTLEEARWTLTKCKNKAGMRLRDRTVRKAKEDARTARLRRWQAEQDISSQ
eukprot:gnl/TRDRNA2_/TRDRNA2_122675_c0_seq1.p1 gnl/TRDRNA2_/TRDRNA2_122675_c0~~gnl/TRDRNA2_/TRDRNA2_122675_c0_seq1.p1  ORF type:complete len:106 (+),score=19.59 gnl/TRDRNA2_/TRDRNA2_122675_c0_seq1:181-498(+)